MNVRADAAVVSEKENKNAPSCPASVSHCSVVGDVESTADVVETQADWKLSINGQFQKDRTSPQATIDDEYSTVVDVGDQQEASLSVHGDMTRNIHRYATAVTDQVVQLVDVQDDLATGLLRLGRPQAVQRSGGRCCAALVDVEGTKSMKDVSSVAVADDEVPARQPVCMERM